MIGRAHTAAFFVGISVVFVLLPVAKYLTLHSNVMDLGVFDRQLLALANGEWQAALSAHLQGYGWALGSLLPARMGTELPIGLVGMQALLLILPTFIFLRIAGIGAALAYVAYSPVWINAHFDFHYDHLAVPLLLGFYLGLKNGRMGWAFLFAGLLVFIKEPFALQTAACGLLVILMAWQSRVTTDTGIGPQDMRDPRKSTVSRERFWLAGAALVMVGCGYFYFAVRFALPYFAPAGWGVFTEGGAFSWLGIGLGDMLGYIITHPLAILGEILTTPGKLTYLFVVFGLLAFIPLLAPSYLIPALPLLAIAMLSRLPNYYDYNTHYTAGLIIPVMFAFIHGLPKAHALWMRGARWVWRKGSGIRTGLLTRGAITPLPGPLPQGERRIKGAPLHGGERRLGGQAGEGIYLLGENALGAVREARLSKTFYALLALWILAGHVMVSPSSISRLFWSDKVWSHSWQAYVPTGREAMMKEAMLKYIPADPEVSVTAQNTVNWYHLAHRKVYTPFPQGIGEPIKVMDWSSRTWDGFWSFVRTGEMPPAVTHDRYADYVVLDLKRPWFIVDKGCEWIYGECRDKEKAQEFLDLVARTKVRYEALFERDGFMILRRR